jgi:hypothetical protein
MSTIVERLRAKAAPFVSSPIPLEKSFSRLMFEAATEIERLKKALGEPMSEMAGTFPLILYFGSREDLDGFKEVVRIAMKNPVEMDVR